MQVDRQERTPSRRPRARHKSPAREAGDRSQHDRDAVFKTSGTSRRTATYGSSRRR
ncbi:hypothetical protein QJS66_20535 [Kocuria rhizophila]|nr:hypothetical protein QJS66_20535 [Kocuria rhizophila]